MNQRLQFFPFARIPVQQQRPQSSTFRVQDERRGLGAQHLPAQAPAVDVVAAERPRSLYPSADGVLVEATRDGIDWRRACYVHRWASLPVVSCDLLPECPECEATRAAVRGRERYRVLSQSFVVEP